MKKILQSFFLAFLRISAQLQLQKNRPFIVGITGSAGKSSAVRATATVLSTKYKTFYTKKGNSETGIPFELLGIPVDNYSGLGWITVIMKTIWQLFTYWPKYEVAVIEMGIDSAAEPKNMSYLLKILRPNIAVLLNASSVHGANFPGPDVTQSIAHEKAKLLYAVPNTGLAIFSTDSSEIANAVAHLSVPQQTFSISGASSDLYLTDYAVTTKGTTFSFVYDQQKYQLHFENACHIKAAFGSFAAAFLVGNKLGISIDTASRALEKNFTLPAGRMSLFKGIKDSTILDSSYNSSPEATQSALEMLSTIPTKGKRIAILGDMRELGIATQAEHEKIAQTAVKHADTIFLIGTSMKEYAVPILEKNKKKVIAFTTAWEAIDAVKNEVERDDLILIKGSQNTIFLEIIVEALLAHPEQDIPKLCRRGEYWDKQRNNLK